MQDSGSTEEQLRSQVERLTAEVEDLRSQRDQAQAFMTLLLQINALAGEAQELPFFLSRCLEKICKGRGWQTGYAWFVDQSSDVLVWAEAAYAPDESLSRFKEGSVQRRLSKGMGLPGRVWGTEAAVWITDLSKENIPRAGLAEQSGLKAAFAFPVKRGPEVIGVFEFYADEIRQPNKDALYFFEKLGNYLAMVIRSKDAERKLKEGSRS